jgi:hypothetical protein
MQGTISPCYPAFSHPFCHLTALFGEKSIPDANVADPDACVAGPKCQYLAQMRTWWTQIRAWLTQKVNTWPGDARVWLRSVSLPPIAIRIRLKRLIPESATHVPDSGFCSNSPFPPYLQLGTREIWSQHQGTMTPSFKTYKNGPLRLRAEVSKTNNPGLPLAFLATWRFKFSC